MVSIRELWKSQVLYAGEEQSRQGSDPFKDIGGARDIADEGDDGDAVSAGHLCKARER